VFGVGLGGWFSIRGFIRLKIVVELLQEWRYLQLRAYDRIQDGFLEFLDPGSLEKIFSVPKLLRISP
jgi:hypothetical protein